MMKIEKLKEALVCYGDELTSKQIMARYQLMNPRSAVHSLRTVHGVAVYSNKRKNSRGKKITKYRAGTPKASVVAAGYRKLVDDKYYSFADSYKSW